MDFQNDGARILANLIPNSVNKTRQSCHKQPARDSGGLSKAFGKLFTQENRLNGSAVGDCDFLLGVVPPACRPGPPSSFPPP